MLLELVPKGYREDNSTRVASVLCQPLFTLTLLNQSVLTLECVVTGPPDGPLS